MVNEKAGARPLGREMSAMISLGNEWDARIVKQKLRVFGSALEAYVGFSEWVFAQVSTISNTPDGHVPMFDGEVFRRVLPRFSEFNTWWWYRSK